METTHLINLYEKNARTLARVASIVLAVFLGVALADLGWTLVPAPGNLWRPVSVEQPRAEEAGSNSPQANMQRLVASELFGKKQASEQAEQRVEDAPETKLSLKLLGVYASDEPSISRAIIASSNGDEKSYAIGDSISQGVELHSVFPDRVIISRAGVLETLRMERDELSDGAARRVQTRIASGGGQQAISAPDPQQLGNIREELLSDPSKAGNYIRVVPAASGGQQRGYRIYPGRDRALFEAAGMRPGDLVTAVNGVSLDDPSRAISLLNELSSAQSINVTVERGGTVQNYTLSTN